MRLRYSLRKMAEVCANSEDLDQTSDLGLHCLPNTLLGVSDYNGLNMVIKQSEKW